MRVQELWREPLFHFLAAGAALFLLFSWVAPEGAGLGEDVIVVDRDSLLTHLQYRTRAFEPEIAAAKLDALSEPELERLIADYVREEALHREALALGMDGNDYVIKRRLIQKVEFLAQGLAEAGTRLSEAELEAYLESHAEDYYVEPIVTFTHVFFDAERRGSDAAFAEATSERDALNAAGVAFTDATVHGDRFPYHVNYVERTPDFVRSHFGVEMARAIFESTADDESWIGPFRSPYGAHVVLIARSEPGRQPEFAELRERVAEDAQRAAARSLQESALDEIVAGYDVGLEYAPETLRRAALP